MKLFGKKKETSTCSCNSTCTPDTMQKSENKKQEKGVKILGSGCAKCMALENATRLALSELELDFDIEHVTDFTQIASFGVMSTPALVFNGEVVSYGKVLSVEEIKKIIKEKM